MTWLSFEFMQRAILAAALVGLAAPSIGVYLVQRKLSLMGDGIGHVAFAGVAAGFLTNTEPLYTAILAAVGGAIAIELLRRQGRMSGDLALALLFYGGIATGLLLAGLAGESTTGLVGYLFGSVLTVAPSDLVVMGAVSLTVLAVTMLLRKELFAISYDEEVAETMGLPVRELNLLLLVLAAVTIAVAMRIVGILLVASMLVLPVAAAQQLTKSFAGTVNISLALGLAIGVAGLVIAFYANVAPAATIALTAIGCFAVTSALRRFVTGA